jgi:hypothetical protein
MLGGFQSLYCRVTDENGCQGVATVTYTPGSAVFTPPQGVDGCNWAFAQNQAAPALPAPNNGIVTGTWSPATIDTSTLGFTQYVFTPDSGCDPFSIDIEIYQVGLPPC